MGDRSWGLLATFMAGAALLLIPMSVAAQNQTQTPHTQTTLHFDLPADLNPRALCPPASGKAVTSKERYLALPSNVIDPKKTPDGWPDLQGSWYSAPYPGRAGSSLTQGVDPLDIAIQCQPLEKLNTNRVNLLIDPMKGRIPYQPWAKAKQMEFLAGMYAPQKRMDVDPSIRCFELGGVPHGLMAGTIELRYAPGAVVFLEGGGRAGKGTRIIPMDATPHLTQDVPLFMGDSRGHWEGHTLVIETTNNREGSNWFDSRGTFHSDAMRVIERFTLVSQDTLYFEATIIDPTVFTQPWTMAQTFDRQKNSKIVDPLSHEDTCHETDNAAERTVRAGLRARAAGLYGYRLNMDLKTGKALDPEDQKYMDQSGQPLGYAFAPSIPDSALPKGFNYTYTPPAPDPKAKDSSASH